MLPTARILDVSPDDYHALPGLSSSLAKTLISRSPAHAKADAEKARTKDPTKAMDLGNVVHRLVLGKGKNYEELKFDSWRTDKAKAARDIARAAGKVPILEEAFHEANKTAEKVRVTLADRGILLDGVSELAVEWFEPSEHGPVQCRAMFDHVWLDTGIILDLKITEDAAPSSIERNAENLGYAIQDCAYKRALAALCPQFVGRVDLTFAFCETDEPRAVNLCRGDGLFRELGERRWTRAVQTWAQCIAADEWPSYGRNINPLSAPAWALAREEYAA